MWQTKVRTEWEQTKRGKNRNCEERKREKAREIILKKREIVQLLPNFITSIGNISSASLCIVLPYPFVSP